MMIVMEFGRDSTTRCGNPRQQQQLLLQLVEGPCPVMPGEIGGGGASRGFAAGLDQASTAPPAAQRILRMAGLASNDAEDFPGVLCLRVPEAWDDLYLSFNAGGWRCG